LIVALLNAKTIELLSIDATVYEKMPLKSEEINSFDESFPFCNR